MAISSRTGLKEYALRALGAPVLEINVDDDQLEDRIDEALEFFNLYHYEGVERIYLKHKITASELTITTNTASDFSVKGVKITGQTSGALAYVQEYDSDYGTDVIRIRDVEGTFQAGETVTTGGATAVLAASDFYTAGDTENHYITVPDYVWGVTRIVPITQGKSSKGLFDLQYQLRLNDLYDLTSTSLIYYKSVMSHISLLDIELNGYPLYRFNRLNEKLYIDMHWPRDLIVDNYVLIEAYRAMDPANWTKIWGEPWLKHYVIALFKKQWGTNLKKFSGIALPGGVTLDGDKIYDEGVNEQNQLEDDLMTKSAPLDFFLG